MKDHLMIVFVIMIVFAPSAMIIIGSELKEKPVEVWREMEVVKVEYNQGGWGSAGLTIFTDTRGRTYIALGHHPKEGDVLRYVVLVYKSTGRERKYIYPKKWD